MSITRTTDDKLAEMQRLLDRANRATAVGQFKVAIECLKAAKTIGDELDKKAG